MPDEETPIQPSEPPKPRASTIEFGAPEFSMAEIAGQFDEILKSDQTPAPPSSAPARSEEARVGEGAAEAPEPVSPEGEEQIPAADEETKAEGEETPAEESGDIRTVGQLAEAMEMEEGDLLSSLHVTQEDGSEIALQEVIDSWRSQPDAALAAQERDQLEGQFEEAGRRQQSEHDSRMAQAVELVTAMQVQLSGEAMSETDLLRLRQEEPERAVEYQLKQLDREKALNDTIGRIRQQAERNDAERSETKARHDHRELAKVRTIWPELVNPVTSQKIETDIRTYLRSKGMSDERIGQINSASELSIIRDAMGDSANRISGAKALRAAKEKGLKAPKPAPSARKEEPGQSQLAAGRLSVIKERLARSGSVDDAAAAFKEMGMDR